MLIKELAFLKIIKYLLRFLYPDIEDFSLFSSIFCRSFLTTTQAFPAHRRRGIAENAPRRDGNSDVSQVHRGDRVQMYWLDYQLSFHVFVKQFHIDGCVTLHSHDGDSEHL